MPPVNDHTVGHVCIHILSSSSGIKRTDALDEQKLCTYCLYQVGPVAYIGPYQMPTAIAAGLVPGTDTSTGRRIYVILQRNNVEQISCNSLVLKFGFDW